MRPRVHRRDAGRRLVADAAARPRARRDRGRAVRGGADRLRLDPAARSGARARRCRRSSPYEAPYRPLLPVDGLRAGRLAPHARVRHDARAARRGRGRSARAGRGSNPRAWSREPLTVDDVLGAPRVCDPLGVRDCCLVTDGGGALVVVSAERARALRRPPVLVLGGGEAHGHRHISSMPDLTRTAAAESGPRAFAEAGLGAGRRGQRAALRRLHDHPDPVPRGPRLLRQGRGRRVRRRAAASGPAARCR